MKEERFFYTGTAGNRQLSATGLQPLSANGELPEDEARHAVRVLRLQAGDEIYLIDGQGAFHRAEITMASSKHCCYRVMETMPQEREWNGHIHIAMAPTKMMERTEWFAEKATEIGIDEFSFLDCRLSERRQMRIDRIENKVLGAVKQSRKAWMPRINAMQPFRDFVEKNNPAVRPGYYGIAHCYDDIPREDMVGALRESIGRQSLAVSLGEAESLTILVGPEGDFHHDEVLFAIEHGYHSVSLGTSRLRTETAALYATMLLRTAAGMS